MLDLTYLVYSLNEILRCSENELQLPETMHLYIFLKQGLNNPQIQEGIDKSSLV